MLNDFRYALRTLQKAPTFSTIALLTIALGIAANAAIFGVVNAVLLRPLPFPDEARIVRVWTSTAAQAKGGHSAGDFQDVQRETRTLQAIAGYRGDLAAVSAQPGSVSQLAASYVTADFFDVLGTRASIGRTFTRTTDGATAERLVVLSQPAWQQMFGTDRSVVGRTVRVNAQPYTVVGVMPRGFQWPDGARLWLLSRGPVPPSPIEVPDPLTNRDVSYFEAVARLKPGVSLADAQNELHQLATMLQRQHPKSSGTRDLRLVSIRQDMVGDVRDALIVIQGAVALVLAIACANVSSLLIARATGRRRELAIRAALGATRTALVRQLLAESLVLSVGGGLIGLMGGWWLIAWLVRVLPSALPRTEDIGLDATVATVTLLASIGSGMLFGVMPAWQASRTDAATTIKETGDRGSSRARGRSALVVAEVALTLVLLVSAGLLANSFLRLQRVDPGFRPERVTVADLNIPQTRYPKGADQVRVIHRLLEALTQHSELQVVGVGFPGPLHGRSASAHFYVEGQKFATPADQPFTYVAAVSGGYFGAMGIPRFAGRTFAETDSENASPVAIVSAALGRRYWPGANPVGKRLRFEDTPTEPWFTIVGVVDDVRQLGLNEDAPPLLYLPYAQFPLPFTTVAIRSSLPETAVTGVLRSQLTAVDPDLAYGDVSTLSSVVSHSIEEPRFRAILIGCFAVLALILAAVGVYGLISYSVTQRTREIAILVALGAQPRQVLLTIVREGFMLAATGIGLGLVGALAVTRVLAAFLFGVGATDPLTFGAVALLLLVVAVTASYVPSRRALRVDPLVALRAE
jgi:putative ABC transport system permease protein